MAKDLNKAMIIGNLTRDPEMRTTQSGQQVASFSVATNRQWKNASGETQEQAEFHDIVVWGRLAEICTQYLAKGRKAYFEGRLQTRQWEAQDGSKRQRTEIVVEEMILLDSRGAGAGGGGNAAASADPGINQTPSQSEGEGSQAPQDTPAQDTPDTKPAENTDSDKPAKDNKPADTALDDIPF